LEPEKVLVIPIVIGIIGCNSNYFGSYMEEIGCTLTLALEM